MIAYLAGELSCGLTFLDWSLYYFSGVQHFYNPLSKSWETLTKDPVSIVNAHKHNKIHPPSLDLLKHCIDDINNTTTSFHSIYVSPKISDNGVDISKFLRDDVYDNNNKWNDEIRRLPNEIIINMNNFLIEQNYKLLILRNNKEDILYNMFNRGRAFDSTSDDELMKLYTKFFGEESAEWGDNLKIWDYREKLALSIRPFDYEHFDITISKTNHYEITTKDMLDNLDKEIYNILDFFNITPANDFDYWKSIYIKWQQLHDVRFYRNWPEIINNIVEGDDIDLSDYRMDFSKDVFIQHILLYNYNLNIKGYGIEALPKNTKLIHDLLEPNIHKL